MDEEATFPGCSGVSEADFKTALRQIASSVAVVTARSGGERDGLTATAVCSVSATPPMMLVCINQGTSAGKLIAASNAFAINFLAEEQHIVARLFSTPRLTTEERFAEGAWSKLATGAPILQDAVASFDCEVDKCTAIGAHHVYFGRVVAITSLDHEILLYRDGSFRRLEPVD